MSREIESLKGEKRDLTRPKQDKNGEKKGWEEKCREHLTEQNKESRGQGTDNEPEQRDEMKEEEDR